MSTSTNGDQVTVDQARETVAAALLQYAGMTPDSAEAALVLTMALDVKGWTHTTRLREFLAKTAGA